MTCVLRPASELVNIYVKLLATQYDNKEGVTCTSGMWETLVDHQNIAKNFSTTHSSATHVHKLNLHQICTTC